MAEHNILHLPINGLVNILCYLPLSDLRSVMLTCKTFENIICSDPLLWKSFRSTKLIIYNNLLNMSAYNKCRISNNWRNGYYKTYTLLRHRENYMPWLNVDDDSIYLSVGSDLKCYPVCKSPLVNKIRWTLESPKRVITSTNTNDITRFKIKGNIIAWGNRNGIVSVYYMENKYRQPREYCSIQDCHKDGTVEVSDVGIITSNNHLSTILTVSNYDQAVKFWQFKKNESGQCELSLSRQFLIPYCVGARCLALTPDSNKLALGLSGNNDPVFLDVEMNEKIISHMVPIAYRLIRDIQWHNENIAAFVTHHGICNIVDVRTNTIVQQFSDPFLTSIYCVKTDGDRAVMIGSANTSRCTLFDTRKQKHHVQMFFAHRKSSPVYSLHFDATNLYTAIDNALGVLDFSISSHTTNRRDFKDSIFFTSTVAPGQRSSVQSQDLAQLFPT